MKTAINKSIYVLVVTLLTLAFSFLVLKKPDFELVPGKTFTNTISAIIVPHHDLVAPERQRVLYEAAEKVNPKTIILVSTNHFNTGDFDIITTDKSWRLTNSYLDADASKIEKLGLPNIEAAFEREHGITNLLSPLKNAFPDVRVIPLIIKPNLSPDRITALSDNLKKVCSNQCLMVGSVDFSHYQPGALAAIHDQFSIKALTNLDEIAIWQTEVDSHETLALALDWAKSHKTESFTLRLRTNSGVKENAPDAESTGYVFGWFERGETIPNTTETFMAGLNLESFEDPRFLQGVDQKIDLADERNMALLCHADEKYCSLNQLFWNAPFWRETKNGLIVAGEIRQNQYRLALIPTDSNGKLLRGEEKLTIINRIRRALDLDIVSISYGYDTINLE